MANHSRRVQRQRQRSAPKKKSSSPWLDVVELVDDKTLDRISRNRAPGSATVALAEMLARQARRGVRSILRAAIPDLLKVQSSSTKQAQMACLALLTDLMAAGKAEAGRSSRRRSARPTPISRTDGWATPGSNLTAGSSIAAVTVWSSWGC
jgi:hypothetical protein